MSTITDQTTILNSIHFAGYTGQASSSWGEQDVTDFLVANDSIPFTSVADLNTTIHITTGFNYYYKMQGYNTSTQRYEVWHSMGAPLFDPPSGHSLENITLVASWIDR